MLDWMLSGSALWFSVPALLGTGLFLIRMVLMLAGGHGVDLGHDADLHMGDHGAGHSTDADHPDSGYIFKLLSFQAASAFAMGFGWAGLAALKSGWEMTWVIAAAAGAGAAMVWLLAVLLKWAYELQASGNINIREAVGSEGVVYVGVPGKTTGKGQVTLVVDDKQRQYNAVTDGEDLPTRTRVKVLGVNEDNTLLVVRAS